MMPFPDSDECLGALLEAFAHAAEQGPMATAGSAGPVHGRAADPLDLQAPGRLGPTLLGERSRPRDAMVQEAREQVRTTLDGVDFLTRMQVSATLSGRDFLACCKELGIEPRSLALAQRRALDDQMAAHFRQTADSGSITRPEVAAALLRELLARMRA